MVTAADVTELPVAAPGLLGKLMAVVRPEFRADIVVPDRGSLVFDTSACRVPGCVRQPRTRGLCKGHYYSWKDRDRPDIDAFAATASPVGLGRKELTVCAVPGCRYGGARRGLCVRHQGIWERSGQPDRRRMAGDRRPGARTRSPGLRIVVLHAVDAGPLAVLCQPPVAMGGRRTARTR